MSTSLTRQGSQRSASADPTPVGPVSPWPTTTGPPSQGRLAGRYGRRPQEGAMRTSLIRPVLILSAVGGLIVSTLSGAYADTKCQQTDRSTGECLVLVEVPGSASDPGPQTDRGAKDSGAGAACYWDPSKQGLSTPPAAPVPCSSDPGYWSNAYNCYISAAKPPPPAGDPSRQGHKPGDGAVYQCYQPQTDIAIFIWAADAPPGSVIGPSPRD